jgi:hypothetical protein
MLIKDNKIQSNVVDRELNRARRERYLEDVKRKKLERRQKLIAAATERSENRLKLLIKEIEKNTQ